MIRKKCTKVSEDGQPCVRWEHSGSCSWCATEGSWCVKHEVGTSAKGVCPVCEKDRVDDLSQKVDKLFAQQVDQAVDLRAATGPVADLIKEVGARWKADVLKASAQAQNEWEDQAGEKLTARLKDFAKRIDNLRDQLNDLAGWSVNAERKLDGLTEPLGESFRRIIGQRLAHLAKRIWVDLPF